MLEWIYKNKKIKNPPENAIGFTYCISNKTTNKKYIGKKFLFFKRRKKVANRKNRKIVIKPSDWMDYYGSSEFLLADIEKYGKDNFSREILSFYNSKKELSYAEIEEQFKRDVLRATLENGERAYYNQNILGKFYNRDGKIV